MALLAVLKRRQVGMKVSYKLYFNETNFIGIVLTCHSIDVLYE